MPNGGALRGVVMPFGVGGAVLILPERVEPFKGHLNAKWGRGIELPSRTNFPDSTCFDL